MADAPRHMSTRQIAEHAARHRTGELPFDPRVAIDFTKPFVCPTLTALYYTPTWAELSPADRLRHTQLSALSFNELIAWFEGAFSATLLTLKHCELLPEELRALFPEFIEDERKHQRMWWTLNRLADPDRYALGDEGAPAITRIAPAARAMMRWLSRHPVEFPVAVWLMLVLEEHGNEIARRCAQCRPDEIEPHFAAAYLAHVRDEARHVQIDWHLLDHLWPRLGGTWRRVNTWLFGWVVRRMLFRAQHAALSTAEALASESADVRRRMPRIRAELRDVGSDPRYRRMMFSAEASPIATHLVDRYPELRRAIA